MLQSHTLQPKHILLPYIASPEKLQREASLDFIPPSFNPLLPSSPDFEADLQEVWSVRRNIHHVGKPLTSVTASPNMSATAGKYSRHGRFAGQQQLQGPVFLGGKEATSRGDQFVSLSVCLPVCLTV